MSTLRKRSYLEEAGGWSKMGRGGAPFSVLEKAIGPYNKGLANMFIRQLLKPVYSETLGKNYMGHGHVILMGEGVTKSDMPLKWDLHVDHFGDETRLRLNIRAPNTKGEQKLKETVNGSADPAPAINKLAKILVSKL